MNDQLGLLTSQ